MAVDVDDREIFHGARLCYWRLRCYHIADLRCTLFIQIKTELIAPRAHDRLSPFSVLHLSRTLFFLPNFAIGYSLILFGHEPNRDTKLGD